MTTLEVEFAKIKSPNPFWLASGPPTNTGAQVERAFDMGWGGAVWKTLGVPITNTSSRLASINYYHSRLMGLNNIELITDRPLEDNLKEIKEVKKKFPKNVVIVSLMVETREEWKDFTKKIEDTGCDGIELNFGCPHGMCEKGMGSAVGQEPKVNREITSWVKEFTTLPVIVKLTPNITNILEPALASQKGGADGISLINTVQSIMGVNLDTFVPYPNVDGKSTKGGYCGPAVKPIALYMVSSLARSKNFHLPISGIGGIATWKDAAEFMLLGATTVQVCTAVMHHGFRIIEDMIDGMKNWMEEKNFKSPSDFIGKSVKNVVDWGELNLKYQVRAYINEKTCIGCKLCYISCLDGAHQAITLEEGKIAPKVIEERCVGCNLCSLVCPVDNCIEMRKI